MRDWEKTYFSFLSTVQVMVLLIVLAVSLIGK